MDRPPLHIDVETRSPVDLEAEGQYAYFDHPSTDVLCAAYAFGNEEPKLWRRGQPCPPEIKEHVEAGGEIAAWNASFERQCWRKILGPRYGWPVPDPKQYRCTMAKAYAMSLPGKLDKCAPALGLTISKDQEGYRLMLQMCKPRRIEPDGTIIWWDDEERQLRLGAYCMQDVRTEQAIDNRVLNLHPNELELFFLDAEINDRGVYIDEKLCAVAKSVVKVDTERLNQEMRNVTGGEVAACSNVQQLKQWLAAQGVEGVESLAKDALADLLIMDIPERCKAALELRQEAAKTSTAKINAMLRRRQKDGRMRGNLQYHGAGTGRWAARGAQLQNLPRPAIIKGDGEVFSRNYDTAIRTIMYGSNVLLDMTYGKPLTIVADCIRGMIVAGPGNDLLASDFSNIEGRGVAWLARQEDKLKAFRAFDAGEGHDLYLIAAGGILGLPPEEARPYRQIGKVSELSMGYQGGPGAFANMAKNYGLKIGQHYDVVWSLSRPDFKEKALEGWAQRGKKSGMDERSWLAAEVVKLGWRAKHPRIVELWKDIEAAAIQAVLNPGQIVQCGYVKYRKAGSFLFCRLPSGRALCYPYPTLKEGMTPWGEPKYELRYKSIHQYTKKWEEKAFYGGLGVENITQAVSRDVMAEAMQRVDPEGYKVVLTVHDEVVSEVPEGFGSLEEFNQLMTISPVWADGFPIVVAGWRGKRYRKG